MRQAVCIEVWENFAAAQPLPLHLYECCSRTLLCRCTYSVIYCVASVNVFTSLHFPQYGTNLALYTWVSADSTMLPSDIGLTPWISHSLCSFLWFLGNVLPVWWLCVYIKIPFTQNCLCWPLLVFSLNTVRYWLSIQNLVSESYDLIFN